MTKRLLEAAGVVATFIAVILLLKATQVPVSGGTQTPQPSTTVSGGSVLKTSWGDPDLQGIWNHVYATTLQRPAEYADREFLTAQEQLEWDRRRAAAPRQNNPGIAKRGTEQDVSGAYNSVFTSLRPTSPHTSLIVDPPNGRLPQLTAEARQRNAEIREYQLALLQATDVCKNQLAGCAGGRYGPPSPRRLEPPPHYPATGAIGGGAFNRADGPEDRGLSERCLGARLPDFGGFKRIVQSPGAVSIFYDTGQGQGWQRTILVTDLPHLPSEVRQWHGDSRGRWEENTLVVDVTNFSSKMDFFGSRENLQLVERWKRLDEETIEYVVTVEDPTTWTRPWTARQNLTRQDERANRIYYEPRCHEGNYGLAGLLAGSRAEEKAFAEGRSPNPATRCSGGCGTGIEEVEDLDGSKDGYVSGERAR
jgi:hypothetical protein